MKKLADFMNDIDKCVRCGTCRAICPTTRVSGREYASARGKITLIDAYLKGEISLSDTFQKHLKECTLCGGCRDTCPNGVPTTDIFIAARAETVEKEGMPFAASFVMKNLLDSSRLMPMAMRLASRLKSIVFRGSETETGLISRFSLPLIGGGRLVPPLADKFFLDMKETKRLSSPAGPGVARVAFFAGCGVNYLMPRVGSASVDALKRAGASVVVPQGQVCCGMPAFYSGDHETARRLALKNIEIFEKEELDFVVTSCATCSDGLKNVFRKVLEDEGEDVKKRVDAFCSRVRDITDLLANELAFVRKTGGGKKELGGRKLVTYHDPCHLNRNLGIRDEPRALIASNREVEFRNMRFPCSCCGLGGSLSFTNYEMSIEVTKRKAESVRDSGADIVATACPGCIVQLRDGLHRYGVDAKVCHVVELL